MPLEFVIHKTPADIMVASLALNKARQSSPGLKTVPTGIEAVDRVCAGLPRGALTELSGPRSSGRTTLLHSALAQITARGEVCAIIDAGDSLDPHSAQSAGVDLNRLLWACCGGRLDKALKIADMLLQGGGFGFISLDLGDLTADAVRRIPMMYWFRFRRAVENSACVFLLISPLHITGSCASLALQAGTGVPRWGGSPHFPFLGSLEYRMSFGRLRAGPVTADGTGEICMHASMDPRSRKIS